MSNFFEVVNSVAGTVTALCAAIGLFYLARQNGLLRQQLARPEPIVSVEASRIPTWSDAAWYSVTVSVRNPAIIPLHVIGIEVAAPGAARLWPFADGYAVTHTGGHERRVDSPATEGKHRLALDFEVSHADSNPGKPGPRPVSCLLLLRRDRADQPMPSLRLTYRWKTNRATTMAIVADIWDRDASV